MKRKAHAIRPGAENRGGSGRNFRGGRKKLPAEGLGLRSVLAGCRPAEDHASRARLQDVGHHEIDFLADPRGAFLRDEVCVPLGIADGMFIGAPERAEPRIAKLKNRIVLTPELLAQFQAMQENPDPLRARALGMHPNEGIGAAGGDHFDTPQGHRAEVPAANGIMTAGALARLYACLGNYGKLDGVRILSEECVRTMSQRQTFRPDRIIVVPVGYALGYMTGGTEGWPQGPRVTAFGHAGLGGSIGFCDPEIGMAFGLTLNALAMDLIGYGRTARLADAARRCAEALV